MRLSPLPLIALALSACGDDNPRAEVDMGTIVDLGNDADSAPIDLGADDMTVADDAGDVTTCPTFGTVQTRGTVTDEDLDEMSGLVESRLHPGTLFVHNDGDTLRFFAIAPATGAVLAEYDMTGIAEDDAADLEDMAAHDGKLYFGDIGDNGEQRTSVRILRVDEPTTIPTSRGEDIDIAAQSMTFTYPGGAKNSETLLFDPRSNELYVVTKEAENAGIYRIGAFEAGATRMATRVADVPVTIATGGSISTDGRFIAVRGYSLARAWYRLAGESIADAFARRPCLIPTSRTEPQGEVLAFSLDGSGYFSVSEYASGDDAPIYFFMRQ